MAKYERDTRESDDTRPFDGGDDEEEGGSHLPVVIVISLLVLAAFGGVVWLAYNNGVARGRADVPATVTAQNAPSEQPAVAPGSGAPPAKQIKIYQQRAGSEEDAGQQVAAAPPAQLPTPPPALRSRPVEAKPMAAQPVGEAASPKSAPVTRVPSSPRPRFPAELTAGPPAKPPMPSS